MDMAKTRKFLNFPVPDDLLALIDDTAKKSGLVRAKQARALIEYALGYERKPYIPAAHTQGLPFKAPAQDAPGRRRRKAA